MNLMIEGVDRVGKDSLIAGLRKHFTSEFLVVKVDKPQNDAVEYNQRILDLCTSNDNLIFNRSHIGEAVYGKLYRNSTIDILDKSVYNLEKYFSKLLDNTVLILLIGDPKVIFTRNDGLSSYSSEEQIEIEQQEFIEAVKRSSIPNKLVINTSGFSVQQIVNKCFVQLTKMIDCNKIA